MPHGICYNSYMTTGGEGFEGDGPSAPAGWYPVDGGSQRYWDGVRWTEHIAPAPAPGPTPDVGGGQPGQPPGPDPAPFAPAPLAPAPSPLGPGPAPVVTTSDDRSMAMLTHLLALVSGFLGPLIVWLIKKDQSPFVDYHGKEALNFQISLFIYWIATILLVIVLIGLLLIPVLLVLQILFPILAAVAANKGQYYRYPLTIRIIR